MIPGGRGAVGRDVGSFIVEAAKRRTHARMQYYLSLVVIRTLHRGLAKNKRAPIYLPNLSYRMEV
jgi:hypothetical protein